MFFWKYIYPGKDDKSSPAYNPLEEKSSATGDQEAALEEQDPAAVTIEHDYDEEDDDNERILVEPNFVMDYDDTDTGIYNCIDFFLFKKKARAVRANVGLNRL